MMKFDDKNRKIKRHAVNSLSRSDAVMTASGLAALLSSALTGCVKLPDDLSGMVAIDVESIFKTEVGALAQLTGTSSVNSSNALHHATTAAQTASAGGEGGGEGSEPLPFLAAAVTALNSSLGLDENNEFNYSELSTYKTDTFSSTEGFLDLFSLVEDSAEHTMYFQSYDDETQPVLVYDAGSKMLIALVNDTEGDLSAISGYVDDEVVPMYDGEEELVVQLDSEDAILFAVSFWDATITVVRNVSSEAYDIYTRTSALEYFGGDEGSEPFTFDSLYSYYLSEEDEQGEEISYYGGDGDGIVVSEIGESTAEDYRQTMFEDSTTAELVMMSVIDLKEDDDDTFALVEEGETADAELLLITLVASDSDSEMLMSGKTLRVIYDFGDDDQDASFLKEEAYIIDSGFSIDDTGQYQLGSWSEGVFDPFGISFGLDEFRVHADVFNEMLE